MSYILTTQSCLHSPGLPATHLGCFLESAHPKVISDPQILRFIHLALILRLFDFSVVVDIADNPPLSPLLLHLHLHLLSLMYMSSVLFKNTSSLPSTSKYRCSIL